MYWYVKTAQALTVNQEKQLCKKLVEEKVLYALPEPEDYLIEDTEYGIQLKEAKDAFGDMEELWVVYVRPDSSPWSYPSVVKEDMDLKPLLEKYSPRYRAKYLGETKPQAKPADRLNEVMEQLYDIGNRNDPRAKPLLEEYQKLTGNDHPKFMV